MEKMENPSNLSCLFVGFGDNGNGCVTSDIPCMIMPLMTQHNSIAAAHPPPDTESQNNNNRIMGGGHQMMVTSALNLPCSSSHLLLPPAEQQVDDNCYFMDNSCSIKAKIMAHPHYPRLLAAYINCHKVGAPPEVVSQLEEACASEQATSHSSSMSCIGENPSLDQFMEAYCEMLTKYEQELTKPLKEAMLFLSKIECQFKSLTVRSFESASCEALEQNGSSEDEVDVSENCVDPLAEDRDLKGQLLRKYSGYLGSLKQEFLKKRKKGKLPKEARQQLLDWWGRHYKWPYPSESQKLSLAESTGLDQKQINNWFINQRKRHWKPSEEMQFVVMDAASQHPHHYYNMDEAAGQHHFPMDYYTTSLL